MNKENHPLTPENLAIVGILDEVYDLYNELCLRIINAFRTEEREHTRSSFSTPKYNRLCKKTVNEFINKHIHIFSSDFHILYINQQAFSFFSMFEPPRNHSFTYRLVTFKEFLSSLHRVAHVAIYHRISKDKPKMDADRVTNLMDSHILSLVEKEKSKKVFTPSSLDIAAEICKDLFPVVVYRNTQSIACIINDHDILSRALYVPLLGKEQFVILPVRYCKTCKKYFVSAETLGAFESMYGKMLLQKMRVDVAKDAFSELDNESELHRWGYNVREGQSTEIERQNIILMLIKNDLMSPESICRDIENAIRLFWEAPSKQRAVQKWQRDLVFTRELLHVAPSGYGELKYRPE